MKRTIATFTGSLTLACVIGASVAAQTPTPKPTDGRGKAFFFFNQEEAPAIQGLPYSAEATTKVSLVMFDGTRMNQTVTAKVYRDSAGRTRREQAVIGLEALDPNPSVSSIIQIVDPVARVIYTLNPGSKTALRSPLDEERSLTPKQRGQVGCQNGEPPPVGGINCVDGTWVLGVPQNLGIKTLEGLTATGDRVVTTIPAAKAGADRPIEIIDEGWTSVDLKVVLQTLHRDPRSGDVEYTLTKISRQEPDAALFKVPAGYEIRGPAGQK